MIFDYSQNGEQLIICEILDLLHLSKGTIVDLGAGNGRDLSNSRHLIECGWTGVLIDLGDYGNTEVHKHFLTVDNVLSVVAAYTTDVDVLSIDLDGNDYWILDKFLSWIRPSLVICEVNTRFKRDEPMVMVYNPEHRWSGNDYYGMSIKAVEILCAKHGYILFEYNGVNAFLVRSDYGLTPRNWVYERRFDHQASKGQWVSVK
jgi:hypothetical protein